MSDTLATLSIIAAEAREFEAAARSDGFDASDSLKLIGELAGHAEGRILGIPAGAPALVVAILSQDTVCDDVLDMIENCFDHVIRDRASALAVRAKLQKAVDGTPADADDAEASFRDRTLDQIDLIDAHFPQPA